jgi:hypothetical protein
VLAQDYGFADFDRAFGQVAVLDTEADLFGLSEASGLPACPRLFAVALNRPTHLIVSARRARLLRRPLGIVVHRFLRRTWVVAAEAMPAQKPNALTDHHQTKRQLPDSIELGRLSRRLGVEGI